MGSRRDFLLRKAENLLVFRGLLTTEIKSTGNFTANFGFGEGMIAPRKTPYLWDRPSTDVLWLSDEAWLAIKPHLPKSRSGARRVDERRVRYDQKRYRDRHLIENAFCRMEDFRRIATRYDKLAAVAFWF